MADTSKVALKYEQIEYAKAISPQDAFRDGEDLLIQDGFKSPKICIQTGVQLPDNAKNRIILIQRLLVGKKKYLLIFKLFMIYTTFFWYILLFKIWEFPSV